MKVAILGGSFDPVHSGHLQIAKEARKRGMDEVWFMPTYDTPLKDRALSDPKERLAMLRRAIAPYRHFRCSTLELERPGKSYTIDTVRELRRRYPGVSFSWLIGSDQAAQLDAWKDMDELARLAEIIVFTRGAGKVESVYPITYQPMTLVDVSSTEIRSGYKWPYLPKSVRRYIASHQLYLDSFVQARLSKPRYEHSVRVAQLAEELAKANGLEEMLAWQIGMLHDICKEMPKDTMRLWMRQLFPKQLQEAPAVWHGYLGSVFAKRWYGIEDKRVLHAIYHHVKGESPSPYAKLIFCADKLEPGRGYDSSAQIALCKRSIQQGFARVKQEQQAYLEKEKRQHE